MRAFDEAPAPLASYLDVHNLESACNVQNRGSDSVSFTLHTATTKSR